METAVAMLWTLCLLPGSLTQPSAFPSSPLPSSLIPDISPLPLDDLLKDYELDNIAPFPRRPSNLFDNLHDDPNPKNPQPQPQPQPPRFPFPPRPLYLSPYQYQPSSDKSQSTPLPSVYNVKVSPPAQPGRVKGYSPGGGPQGVLGLYYRIDRAQKGLDPEDYNRVSPRFFQKKQMCFPPPLYLTMAKAAAASKEVRGWLGIEPPAPRPPLDLSEEGYQQQPLSVGEQNVLNAKLTIMACPHPDRASLYDHLSTMMTTVLEKMPENPADDLETMSALFKTSRMRTDLSFKEIPDRGRNAGQARAEWNLFKTIARPSPNAEPESRLFPDQKDDEFICLPNTMRQAHLLSFAGAGLPSDYYVRVTLALRELARAWPFISLRLWGVVHGLHGDYTVAEGELREGDYDTDVTDDDDDEEEDVIDNDDIKEDVFDAMSEDIKPVYKAPRKIPCEHAGVGLNRKVYFVCSQPGLPWIRLPHVTPAQVSVARQIRKYFTGDLDHKMTTFPPFPGNERNYLRAQIARISAATHVSPIGVFKFEEEGEEEEEAEGARDTVVVDLDFEGLNMKEMSDPNLMSWVHHSAYILPQGRTAWYNPVQRSEGEEVNEKEEEEREEADEPEPEAGPPLLAPLAEDTGPTVEMPGWVTRASTKLVPEYAVASVHSLNWPGALAVATDKGRFFENLYVGWGQKACGDNFEPALPEAPMDEFPTGPEVIEAEDPSPETEAAIRAAMKEQEVANEEEEEEEDGIIEDDEEGPDLSD
ncbi:hypothetical protein ACOMHN_050002 [Nucella lapillus]